MSRRSHTRSPSPRLTKKPRLTPHLTSEDFKDGVVLAPMVRSGALPTRLFALKHGAKLVWGPEMVDKAILHATRVVDPVTGVVSYNGNSKAMFTTHPVEKPYLIFQIGSSDPELAVQAAKFAMDDVAGIDLNCGCPKPFSTHSGMGAALLSTPDLLCSILTALRREMPPHISVSAKIRLLPSQEDTLKLVEQIVGTGITNLTVHCRTRNQRMNSPATIHRLKEIVQFVEGLGKGVSVIANGDCQNFEDAKRVREISGAHSVMIATAAESNPSIFSPTPLTNVERTLIPAYIRVCKHLNNHWSSTKWCIAQFKAAHPALSKDEHKRARDVIQKAKSYADVLPLVGGDAGWTGAAEFAEIVQVLRARGDRAGALGDAAPAVEQVDEPDVAAAATADGTEPEADGAAEAPDVSPSPPPLMTPPTTRPNPEPPGLWAPLLPGNLKIPLPSALLDSEPLTPTPTGGVRSD